MRLLLDTHVLLWMIERPDYLSRKELELLGRAEERFVSVISLWEVRMKHGTLDRDGQPKLAVSAVEANAFAMQQGIRLAPLTPADCIAPLSPPALHKDPFDAMLLVHADQLGARLLTRDRKLKAHPLVLIA